MADMGNNNTTQRQTDPDYPNDESANSEDIADQLIQEDNDSVSNNSDSSDGDAVTYHILVNNNGYVVPSHHHNSSDEEDESMAYHILARLLGGNLRRRRFACNDREQPPNDGGPQVVATPLDMSCDLYKEINSFRPQHVNFLVDKLHYNRDRPTPSESLMTSSQYLPRHHCLVDSFNARVFCGQYSSSGNVFISSCQNNNLYLYNTEGNQFTCYKTVIARDVGWSVLSVDFSPDQKWFLYSTWSPYIHVCNVYEEEERHYSLDLSPEYDNQFNFCAFAATFSNDNREILASANDGNLYIYDRERQEKTLTIDAHQDDACAVTFADDSTPFIIYSAGDDGVCKVWDRRSLHEASPRPVGIFAGHKDGITYIDSKGDGRYLITNCKDQTIKLWDTRVFANNDGIQATLDSVSKQRWDYRWQNVPKYVRNDISNKLKGDVSVMTYSGHMVKHTLIRCHFSPSFTTGQRYIYTGCASGQVVIYDVITGEVVKRLSSECSACVRDVSWHPTEVGTIVSSTWDGTIQLWSYNERPNYKEPSRTSRAQYFNFW